MYEIMSNSRSCFKILSITSIRTRRTFSPGVQNSNVLKQLLHVTDKLVIKFVAICVGMQFGCQHKQYL